MDFQTFRIDQHLLTWLSIHVAAFWAIFKWNTRHTKYSSSLMQKIRIHTIFENLNVFARNSISESQLFKQLGREFLSLCNFACCTVATIQQEGSRKTITWKFIGGDTSIDGNSYVDPVWDVVGHGNTLVINNYAADFRYKKYTKSLRAIDIRSSLFVPISNGKAEITHVLCIHASKIGTFTESMVKLMVKLAHNLGYYLSNLDSKADAEFAKLVFEYTNDGIVVTDVDGIILTVNPAFCRITGYSKEEVVGSNPRMFKSGQHTKDFYSKIFSSVEAAGFWKGQIVDIRKNGTTCIKDYTIFPLKQGPNVTNYVGIYSDITEKEKFKDTIEQLLKYDPLTMLPNRVNANNKIGIILEECRLSRMSLAFLYIDLDNFNYINDSHGYEFGDLVIKEVSARLREILQPEDILARFDGDEFLALVKVQTKKDAAAIASQIVSYFSSTPLQVEGKSVLVGTSIGIAVYPLDSTETTNLIKFSDLASYHAKKQSLGFAYYSYSMRDYEDRQLVMGKALQTFILDDKFAIMAQPYVDFDSSQIVGKEILVKFPQGDYQSTSTQDWIGVAENFSLVTTLGQRVLEKAIAYYAQSDKMVSINVSATQVAHPSFIVHVRALLERYEFNPQRLELEITESIFLAPELSDTLEQLSNMGVSIAIGAFGTRYSNLEYLAMFPVQKVKLGAALTSMYRHDKYQKIIHHLVEICKDLELAITVEGIEDAAQFEYFRSIGCKYAQGNFISAPKLLD